MKITRPRKVTALLSVMSIFVVAIICYAAYNHNGDIDSANFRTVHPNAVGTKLDSCATCHSGGSYTAANGKLTVLGSCQWCHYKTSYGTAATQENLAATLNAYGRDYKSQGRNAAALQIISSWDSDNDGYSNQVEINGLTYPGDQKDDPSKIAAPSQVLSLAELEKMPQHAQFMLMNADKSDDSYSYYNGVVLEDLVKAMMLDSATGVTVFSPDGFSTYHPFNPSSNANSYHIFGEYPPGTFYYDERADIALHPADPPNYPTGGWCNYSSPLAAGRASGSEIWNPDGLKMMLALQRDGEYLLAGALDVSNKLNGEGPFRVVPPQKVPGWPDQRSTSANQNFWPYSKNGNDHNAGFSSRTVTMVRVEPLSAQHTDINTYEAGWAYVDQQKIVIYGAIYGSHDPRRLDKLKTSVDSIDAAITSLDSSIFKGKSSKIALVNKIAALKKQMVSGAYSEALAKLKDDILKKTDGCLSGAVDDDDWILDIKVQRQLCSKLQQIWIMLVLIGA